MKAIGSSFLARLRVVRDFENSEAIQSFLKSRSLLSDVESLGPHLLRLKSHVEPSIQDAFYSIFAADVAAELESLLLARAKYEFAGLKDSPDIKAYVTFNLNQEINQLNVSMLYQLGSQTVEFKVFQLAELLGTEEIEKAVSTHPALYWLIDERSPLFSVDAVKNLKIYLLLDRNLKADISREDKLAMRAFARKIVKAEADAESHFPDEIASAAKATVSMIKSFCNQAEPSIEITRHYVPGSNNTKEYQIHIIVTGATAFTIVLAERVIEKEGRSVPVAYAQEIRPGVSLSPLPDIFDHKTNIREALEVDHVRLRMILVFNNYRVAHRRTEKLLLELSPVFPDFSPRVDGENIVLTTFHTIDILLDNYGRLSSAFWAYKQYIDRMTKFFTEKRIKISGEVGFPIQDSGPVEKALPLWKIEEDGSCKPSVSHCKVSDLIQFTAKIEIIVSPKSNLKYIKQIGGAVDEVVHARPLISAIK